MSESYDLENGKVTLNLKKKIYGNEIYESFNKDFLESSKSANKVDIENLFKIYNSIFYEIPQSGPLSHQSIARQSYNYLLNNYNENQDTIDSLLLELEQIEEKLRKLQEPPPSHPFYRDGTLLNLEGSPTYELYYIQAGVKRKISGGESVVNILISVIGKKSLDFEDTYQIIDADALNSIPSGPNIDSDVDLSIPSTQFDEPEELTTTALIETVEDFSLSTTDFDGFVRINAMIISPGGNYIGDHPLDLGPNDYKTLKTYGNVPDNNQLTSRNRISGIYNIQNFTTRSKLSDILTINSLDSNPNISIPLNNLVNENEIDKGYYNWARLEKTKSFDLNSHISSNTNRSKVKNRRGLGIYHGTEVRTKVVPMASENNAVKNILKDNLSFYYKWEHHFQRVHGLNTKHLATNTEVYHQPESLLKNGRGRFNFITKYVRIYGKPIWFFDNKYWAQAYCDIDSKGYQKYTQHPYGFSTISYYGDVTSTSPAYYYYFLQLTNNADEVIPAYYPSSNSYNYNSTMIELKCKKRLQDFAIDDGTPSTGDILLTKTEGSIIETPLNEMGINVPVKVFEGFLLGTNVSSNYIVQRNDNGNFNIPEWFSQVGFNSNLY